MKLSSSLQPLFCPPCPWSDVIPQLMAEQLMGDAQLPLIRARYEQMREGYDASPEEWRERLFTDALHPYNDYFKVATVMLACKHEAFQPEFERRKAAAAGGAIGLDLPTWFLYAPEQPRVMLIAQDPLRKAEDYGDCYEVILSTPFGLHEQKHRNTHGRKALEITKNLLKRGINVYWTDVRKFYLHDADTSWAFSEQHQARYAQLLAAEIDAVKPVACILLGKEAERYFQLLKTRMPDRTTPPELRLPHLSWNALGAVKKRYEKQLAGQKATAEKIGELYAEEITSFIRP